MTGEIAARSQPGALTEERRRTHGEWAETALIAHELRGVIERAELRRRWRGDSPLGPHQIEALGQIGFKAARIIAGDPNHADHWDDIAGYAGLGKDGGAP